MKATFSYLKDNPLLGKQFELASKIAKLYEIDDARDVLINSRLLVENITKEIFDWENLNFYYPVADGERRNLRTNTQYLRQQLDYPQIIFQLMDEVRHLGNDAVHDANFKATNEQAWHVICDINDLLAFLLNSYNGQKINYLRPDMIIASEKFKKRKVFNSVSTSIKNDNVKLAHEYLKAKQQKRRHFGRLRKLFKH